jgi:CRP-like cAMP-binding protein
MTRAQRAKVASTAREVSFAARQRLFDEGGSAAGCWLIHSGRIALESVVPGRGPIVVQTLGPGDVLGWSWLVAPNRWHFGAVTMTPVTAVELDTGRLLALMDDDTELCCRLTRGMFEAVLDRLQNTRARLLDLYGSPRER